MSAFKFKATIAASTTGRTTSLLGSRENDRDSILGCGTTHVRVINIYPNKEYCKWVGITVLTNKWVRLTTMDDCTKL